MSPRTRTLYLPGGGTIELPMPGNLRVIQTPPLRGAGPSTSLVVPITVAALVGGAVSGLLVWVLWPRT